MKETAVVLLLAMSIAAFAKDKTPNPKLQAVKVVYVDGKDTEALELTRQRLEHRTCFHLTDNKAEADAILKVDQGPTRPETGVSKTNVGMTPCHTGRGLHLGRKSYGSGIFTLRC